MKQVQIVQISDGGNYAIFCDNDIGVMGTIILFNSIEELITSYIEVGIRFVESYVYADILKTATVIKEINLNNINLEYQSISYRLTAVNP